MPLRAFSLLMPDLYVPSVSPHEFAAVGPDEGHRAVGVRAADREAVEVGLGLADLLGGGDQLGLGLGGLDAEVLEDVGAVVEGPDADEEGRAVDLVADGDGLLGDRVGVLGLVPGAELLGDVRESAVLDVSGGVGVAVLDEVRGALGVVERGLDPLCAGVDRYVLDLDLRALVGLLERGDGRVDDLLLGLVADLLEEPDTERAALVVTLRTGVGGLRRAGGGGEAAQHKRRSRGGNSGRKLHPEPLPVMRCIMCNVRFVLHNWQESRSAFRRRQVVSTTL